MDRLKPSLVRQLFTLMLILFFMVLILKELIPYLTGILGAITFYVILRGWMRRLTKKGWSPVVAGSYLIGLSFVGILVPTFLIILLVSSKLGDLVSNLDRLIGVIKAEIREAESYFGYNLSESIDTSRITNWLSTNLQSIGEGTFNAFIAIGIMYFMLYYMLIYQKEMKRLLISYIPMTRQNLQRIGREGREMVRSNALGIPLVAFFQGLVALIGYLIVGVNDPLFWFVITAVGAMVPFIGTALAIVPLTILLYSQDMIWQAIFIVIYGITIVGVTDNLLRIYILNRLSAVHPLITLFGVVVGVPLFGFIGLIFGPLLVSLFLLILKIYRQEYGNSQEKI